MSKTTALVPMRMSYEDCARSCAAATVRHMRGERRAAKQREQQWTLKDFPAGGGLGGPRGADLSRLTMDWIAWCMSPDDATRGTIRRLRARARDLESNNSWAASYLNLACVNVIGSTGFRHQARVRNNDDSLAAPLNKKIHKGWETWAQAPTLDGKFSLTEFSHQLLRTQRRDGEIFVRLWTGPEFPFGLALEAIDADLVDETLSLAPAATGGNEIRQGVEVDRYGRPVAYHVFEDYYKQGGDRTRVRIPAEEIIHLYRPKRVNQSRGVTELLPAMIALRMLDGYEEAELVAARIAASKMGFFVNKANEDGEAVSADPNAEIFMEANPGQMEKLPMGWEFSAWDPQHPTNAFPAFQKSMLRKVASALGVSYNALCSDLEGVNYSSMRSGLLIERDLWRTLQEWWATAFLQRVYQKWLANALLSGGLRLDSRDPRKYLDVRWGARGWPWVDPLKDNTATVLEVSAGLGTRTAALAEQGEDFEEVIDRLAEEQEYAREMGVDISGGSQAGAGDPALDPNAEEPAAGTKVGDGEDAVANGNGKAKSNGNGAVPGESRDHLVARLARESGRS
jgi:lambda family phage portal protein